MSRSTLADTLQREPWRFGFFQTVRLLEALARHRDGGGAPGHNAPVGFNWAPSRELVRFRSVLSRSFPAAEITGLELGSDDGTSAADMQVAFIGLTGPSGVLPEHYLDLLYRQVRNKDYALRDFFDLFNHRTVSLFYRAWEKYRPAIGYERAQHQDLGGDLFIQALACLIGLGTGGLQDRLPFSDQDLFCYAGHFAHAPRSAVVLRGILDDYLGVPVQIEQFVGRWLPLDESERSRLPGADVPSGQYNRLGEDVVIGSQVWDQQAKFRLRLGPMPYAQFRRFLPDARDPGNRFGRLVSFVRMYAGADLDFDVNLMLEAGEVPELRLGGDEGFESRLGWNTWFQTGDRMAHADEPLFTPEFETEILPA